MWQQVLFGLITHHGLILFELFSLFHFYKYVFHTKAVEGEGGGGSICRLSRDFYFYFFFPVNANCESLLITFINKNNAKHLVASASQLCCFSVLYHWKNLILLGFGEITKGKDNY